MIAAMAVMIILSQIGINIGPLLAGAGVLGLAVGFGAQKMVQDIIARRVHPAGERHRCRRLRHRRRVRGRWSGFTRTLGSDPGPRRDLSPDPVLLGG
ncbi:MAG: mechanosensitive ion channel [Arhodomonas sp.]|nr:mechanosensitive ion channel [Arhodomonas sp.]